MSPAEYLPFVTTPAETHRDNGYLTPCLTTVIQNYSAGRCWTAYV